MPGRPSRRRRALLWGALVALLAVAQSMLVWLTLSYEATRAQEQVETVSANVAGDVRLALSRDLQGLQALLWNDPTPERWRNGAAEMLRGHRELLRIERRDTRDRITDAVDSPYRPPLFTRIRRDEIDLDTEVACAAAARVSGPIYSRSYFVPLPDGLGIEVMDVCMPQLSAGQVVGFLSGTLSLGGVLTESLSNLDVPRTHELSFVEGDGTRLARVGLMRGAGVYVSERLIDLPGITLQLRVDSAAGSPRLIPNLTVALVLGLSLALAGVVLLLVRDVRRRARAENALAEALAFRKAMEDSLVTGLRARDLQGRVTYVNPAFCQMVGFSAEEIVRGSPPPYWPPELAEEYARRQAARLDAERAEEARQTAREGFETTFVRRSGERFPVLIFEAPLVDGSGQHTGWMSAVLDVSEQRRMEEISRQQQERLQATARLATVGEMASLLSHELNQPLAAIASYAAGSLNLMQDDAHDPQTHALLKQAAERIAEQAERAGRVIKSVHDFVRRREQAREAVRADVLVEAVLPLVRLQARKSGTRVEVDLPSPVPRVMCDRTMVEQVLLNLTRNGIQAMDGHTPAADRELRIKVRQTHPKWVTFGVIDRGPGVPSEVAQRLFTPFFTTRPEGMGLGLSLCRTVIEQHGGALDFVTVTPLSGSGATTEFRFTLPADGAERKPAPRPSDLASSSAHSSEPP
jgi:two-component system sensor histidine kinase DctS